MIKLNELIDQHTTCYTRLETVTFHRIITQHHTTNQVENDGRIPKCFDTAILANFGSLSRGQPRINEFLKTWDGLQRDPQTHRVTEI